MSNLLSGEERSEISRSIAKALAYLDNGDIDHAKRWGKVVIEHLMNIGVLDEPHDLARWLIANVTRVDVWEEGAEEPKRDVPFNELGDGLDVLEVLSAIHEHGCYCGGGGAAPAFELRLPGK